MRLVAGGYTEKRLVARSYSGLSHVAKGLLKVAAERYVLSKVESIC